MLRHQRRQLAPQGRQSPSPSIDGTPAWLLSHSSLSSLSLSRLITAPQTLCGIQAGSPTGFHARLEDTPPSTGAGYRGQKEGTCSQPKGWPGAGEGCRAAPASKRKGQKGTGERIKRERSPERGNAYRETKTEHPSAGRRDIKTREKVRQERLNPGIQMPLKLHEEGDVNED